MTTETIIDGVVQAPAPVTVPSPPPLPVFNFSAKSLCLVYPYKAANDIRYYLQGINIEPHPTMPGIIMCATDGHQLAAVYDPNGYASRAVIIMVERPLYMAARHKDAGMINSDGLRMVVMSRGIVEARKGHKMRTLGVEEMYVQSARKEIIGQFPQWRKVVPNDPDKLTPGIHGCLNPKYLKRLAETGELIAKHLGSRYGQGAATHWTVGPQIRPEHDPVVTRFDANHNVVIVSMPMRSDNSPVTSVAPWMALPEMKGTGVEVKKPASEPIGRTTSGAIG